jgi:hypothetical protein
MVGYITAVHGYLPMPGYAASGALGVGAYTMAPTMLGYHPTALPTYGAHFFNNAMHGPFFNNSMPNIITIASAITIKLTSENCMSWRAQVGPLLRSHMLMVYVDGSIVCPDPDVIFSHVGGMHQQPNLAHQHWTH